ncbi:iron-containing alcohol dehydrogenase family protein [Nonomuraea lactucae]|uniref:iron-containing alcohol dehydrogenase family protein n=1 Tax=Nonomuraea lactucae TaxID=2249762 RepID=UPI000DE3D91D|nr:iron-containing alcohol dehydrogenase [Nonomuraea lactucae]
MTFTIAPVGLVHCGEGSLGELPAAVATTGKTRAFVVTDPGIRTAGILDEVLALLPSAGVFAEVEPNPSTTTIERAARAARSYGDAAVVAVGGGSSLDAAKAVALAAANPGVDVTDLDYRKEGLRPGLPIVAVPTTAGTGAESNGFGVIEDTAAACKIYLGNASTQPVISILDPALTIGLPPRATAATGVDALVHGIESLTSRGRNPVSEAYAHHAVKLVFRWLPHAVKDGTDLEARGQLLLGSHLAGRALGISGLGLVHGIAHAITARTGAAHGLALASVLGAVLEFNLQTCAEQYADIALDLGLGRADGRAMIEAVREFVDQVGVRTTPAELGCTPAMAGDLARVALADPVTANTPRLPSQAELRTLITASLKES